MDKLLCPYCGSDDYDIYDSETTYPENVDFCICDKCEGRFKAVYTFSHIEQDD